MYDRSSKAPRTGPLRLLLVDHDPTHVRLVRRAFEGTDFTLATAATAAEAIDEAEHADFLIVEHHLPDAAGLDLLRQIGLPGVLMSSGGDESLAVAAIKAGALDFVVKTETSLERLPRVVQVAWRDWMARQEREAMAAALARSEQHLRLAQTLAGVGSFEVSFEREAPVVHASEALLRAIGRDAFTLEGFLDAVHEDDRDELRERLLDDPPRDERFDLRFRIRRPDGDVRHHRLLARAERAANGRVAHLVAALIDLTEREEAARLLRAREEELRHAQKMEAVGRLANGVAHDFNNLLMGVIGCADIALGKLEESHPARPFVDAIKSSAGSGSSVVSQLLTFGRRRDGAEGAHCVVDDVIADTERLLRALLDEDIHLHVTLDGGALEVGCDAGQLEQAVVNLAVNARHAMPDGGTLVISTHDVATDDGREVVLTVADDGVGMTPATQARIFEPFFTTKPKEQGTGLGLSMVYGLVQSAGGRIEVESEVGLGTVFRLVLPVRGDDASEATGATAELPPLLPTHPPVAARAASEPPRPPGERHVLLVEDHALTRKALSALLREVGWTVHAAESAAAAESMLDTLDGQVQAVVSDLTLPDGRGDQLVARLRDRHPELAVLFLTGLDPNDDPDLARAASAPRTAVAMKPVDIASLAERLDRLVDEG